MRFETIDPGIRLICAPNPSPMTERGTNTYLVGQGEVALIDPGPALPAHLDAILAALSPGERIAQILVTHAHMDHTGLVPLLRQVTDAPVLAYGDAFSGRSDIMARLADAGLVGGGEGLDTAFRPDRCLADGEVVSGATWSLRAIWTPGHIGGHLCYASEDVIFSGDHVMGWATSMVSPPDGDLTQFMASCHKLAVCPARRLLPGHGAPVDNPAERIAWLIAHRQSRETQILETLAQGPATTQDLTTHLYQDVDPRLHPAASRNVFAHLVDLYQSGAVTAAPSLAPEAVFARP